MRGRLALSGKTWLFENAPVRVKFLIRADDAKGRLLLGRSIADLIRNQGMEVEALEYERSRCSETMNKSDPADLAWSIYTEGWGTVFASQRHEEDFVTQYCPSGGSLPGASRGLRWRYSDDRLDALGADLLYGRAGDRVAHELASTKASRLALEEAVRVYVAGRDLAIVANANRLGTMPLYDRSGGFGSWTWRSATPAAGPDGKRTLRIGVKGPASPFSSAWDSFGVDGFANPFQHTVLEVACDFIELPDPATASPFANRDRLVESAVDPGGLAVPATALVWDGASAAWKPVAPGTRAKARLLFEYDRGPWQDGQSYTSAEIAYSLSMTIDWSKKDGAADKAHDSDIESFNAPWLEPLVAFEFPDDRHVVVYGNSSWTWDLERLRYSLSTVFDAVPWPIDEALENLVLNGGASGARYRFNPWEEGYEEVDLAAPKVFADLESELERLAAQRKVPSRLAGIVGLDEAQRARVAALSFMRSHGHALDSNGPWVVDKIWYDSGAVELAAFKAYPFPPDRARKLFSGNLARIDQLDAPPSVSKRAGFVVSCVASTLSYPEGVAKAAGSEARATLRLIGGGSEKQIAMMAKGGGRFEARILPAELAALPPGTYCVEAEVQVGNTLPDLHSAMLSLLQ
jgi:peptide/nickel transport system substrate-binding protein